MNLIDPRSRILSAKPLIGAVSYLNTKPLVAGLDELADEYELIFDLPSRLADRLHRGDLDVALIPTIEVADNPYTILSDACIGCRGEVWSVKLMCRDAEMNIKSLALDEGSRTSSVLARIILAQKYGIRPELKKLDIDEDWRQSDADAVLIIGDRAMKAADPRFPVQLDLGQTWHEWTGLSFVYAVWAARESDRCDATELDRLGQILSAARDRGVANIVEIAEKNAGQYGLTKAECLTYLKHHLYFTLGEHERLGLEKFFHYASETGLIPINNQLNFHATSV